MAMQDHDDIPALEELEVMYASLSVCQREELLECLLIAAAKGGTAMIDALSPWLLACAAERLLRSQEGNDRAREE